MSREDSDNDDDVEEDTDMYADDGGEIKVQTATNIRMTQQSMRTIV